MSLVNCVAIAIGIASVGFLLYWVGILLSLGLHLMPTMQWCLQQLDWDKNNKYFYKKLLSIKKCAVENSEKIRHGMAKEQGAKGKHQLYNAGVLFDIECEQLQSDYSGEMKELPLHTDKISTTEHNDNNKKPPPSQNINNNSNVLTGSPECHK